MLLQPVDRMCPILRGFALLATNRSTETARYRRTAQDKRPMEFRYRDHFIVAAASLDSSIGDWTADAHIEFSEDLKIHTIALKFGDAFRTEVQAKRFIIKQAKQWVDNRLKSAAEIALKSNRKQI
jgi:hypothetical protein